MGKKLCADVQRGLDEAFSKSKVGRFFKLESRKTSFCDDDISHNDVHHYRGMCSVSDCTVESGQVASPDCAMKPNVGYQKYLAKLKSDLIVATALSSMIGSFAMGLFANLPLGLTPGMDPNTFLAYNLVGFHGSGSMSYKTAMTVVLVEGCAFPAIAVFGIRGKLARLIPKSVRLACAAGIGLFIAFVGLQAHQGLGLIGSDTATLGTVAKTRTQPQESASEERCKAQHFGLAWLASSSYVTA